MNLSESLPEAIQNDLENFRPMNFSDEDMHFFNICVNTDYSSVHVPTNVYDKASSSSDFIQWSEKLDDIFQQNYESDPALSWQYFGSSTGVMRHYPGTIL